MNEQNTKARMPRPSAMRIGRRRPAASDARQTYERYLALARAEERSGRRVEAETLYQYAEHYLRVSAGGE